VVLDDIASEVDVEDPSGGAAVSSGPPALGDDPDVDNSDRPQKAAKSAPDTRPPQRLVKEITLSSSSSDEEGQRVSMSDLNKKREAETREAEMGKTKSGDEGAASKKQKGDSLPVKAADYSHLTKKELQDLAKKRQLMTRGKKDEIIQRLLRADENKICAQSTVNEVAKVVPKDKAEAVAEPMSDALTGQVLSMGGGDMPEKEDGNDGQIAQLCKGSEKPRSKLDAVAPFDDGSDGFIRGQGGLRVNDLAIARYEDSLQRCIVTDVEVDGSGLFGCVFDRHCDEPVWIAKEDLIGLPLPRCNSYPKGHFVLYVTDVTLSSNRFYRMAQLYEGCRLSTT
jgi:hypothetical protein